MSLTAAKDMVTKTVNYLTTLASYSRRMYWKRVMPNHEQTAIQNSCLFMERQMFGLGIALSHVPACGSEIVLSLAWSLRVHESLRAS